MRLFTQILAEYRKGRVVDEATRRLNEMCLAVLSTGKKGELSVTIVVKPGKAEGEYTMSAKVAAKVPTPDIPDAVVFITPEGDVVRTDPRQLEMSEFEERRQERTGGLAAAG